MLTETIQPVVIFYTVGILSLGTGALVYQRKPRRRVRSSSVEPWNLSWAQFALFVWLIITSLILAQSIANVVQRRVPSDSAWPMALLGSLTHLSLLTVFLANYLLKTPLTPQHPHLYSQPLVAAFKSALWYFLRLLPLLYLWGLFLWILQETGVVAPIEMQPLVKIIIEAPSPWLLALFGLLAVVIAPVSEELLFRGALYRFFKARLWPKTALCLSALLFAGFHFPMLPYAVPLFLLGLALGHSYESTGNLCVPILFHALFNLNTFVLILLQRT